MAHDAREYDSTVNFLYGLQKHGIKLGLANITGLMSLLGNPHRSFRSIHIAGTNGKGSTAAALASILSTQGLSVGLYTSPHLVSFTERIRVNNEQIAESDVIDLAARVRSCIGGSGLNPTFFEFVTAMAFYHFSRRKTEWAVIETGMGGRLDATNVLSPEAVIITNISYDHAEFLGETLAEIAREKAGIIKQGVPVITASLAPEIVSLLEETARDMHAEFHAYGKDFSGTVDRSDDRQITISYRGYETISGLTAPLPGDHQLYNICLAVRACEILRRRGLPLSEETMRKGLKGIRIEGRMERVSDDPPVIIDGAHNPAAAECLVSAVKKLFPKKKVILVAGIMSDKNIQGILAPLADMAETIVLTKARYERAADPEKLKLLVPAIREPGGMARPFSVFSTRTVAEALEQAKALCTKDHIILVTGSFYTTGEVKEILGRRSILSRLQEHR
ncbi:MAG: bifunctional folylpolyglutamate synthase/dihydrofolate synthase [Nitrospiraceae bacterium]|nr:MAG: bifunctional folylpolyglutamate synthase/dihydrofolate synthase [Nitrospiraceae bacterium]